MANVISIYPLDIDATDGGPFWMHWILDELGAGAVEVDVAEGPILNDDDERVYFAGLDVPRWSTLDLAAGPDNQGDAAEGSYPYLSYKLGVPAPDVAPTLALTVNTPDPGEITLANPGAETGSTAGWTVRTGDLGVKANGDVTGLDAAEGTHFFYGGNNASGDSTQTLVLSDTGIIAQQSLTLTWKQAAGANGSLAGMTIEYVDAEGNQIGSAAADQIAPDSPLTWTARSLSTTTKDGTNAIRIVMNFTNVGGAETDAYIDDIQLAVSGGTNVWEGDSLADWTTFDDGSATIAVSTDRGLPSPSFKFEGKNGHVSGFYRDMALKRTAAMSIEFDYYGDHGGDSDDCVPVSFIVGASSLGEGSAINFGFDETYIETHSAWGSGPITRNQITGGVRDAVWNHFVVTLNKTGDVEFTATVVCTESATNVARFTQEMTFPIKGDLLGFKGRNTTGHTGQGYIDNITVQQTLVDTIDGEDQTTLTNYVWRWVNLVGEAGVPSPVSRSVQITSNTDVTVTTPTTAPDDYGITKKQIFRSYYDGQTTAYYFVAEIPYDQADFFDDVEDADLGEVLDSELYDLPPDDLRGLIASPNGFLAGFRQSAKDFCVTVQLRPHAWPIKWRLATDYPIVADAVLDTDIYVLTQSHPYIVIGSDPSALTMAKLEKPQGCVSKKSVVTLDGVGVLYASPDGYSMVNRSGVEVLTKKLFTRDQWQALRPESITAEAHDGRVFFWYDTGTTQGGYILDVSEDGFGLVEIPSDYYATAAKSNPINDKLYLVLGNELAIWDGGDDLIPYRWRSKLWQLPRPTSFEAAQIRALDYDNLTLRLYADSSDTPFFTKVLTSMLEFVLPDVVCQKSIEFELEGTSTTQRVEIAETMEELD